MPARDFCLVRHGETTANAGGIIAGITDVPLTALGRDQARALAGRAWPDALTVYASPLIRARNTARLALPGHQIRVHPGLRERDWGVFEGRPLSAQPNRDDTPDGGEAWPAMLHRVEATILAICAACSGTLPVLVCHSGVIRATRVLWTTGDVGTRPPNATPLLYCKAGPHLTERPL
ncbi:MAG: phosphoglycerate mutase [Maritimibacter sp.]|nr:phosphoglycerate mutase [Maritimibacter sp.]